MRDLKHQLKIDNIFSPFVWQKSERYFFKNIYYWKKNFLSTLEFLLCDKINE